MRCQLSLKLTCQTGVIRKANPAFKLHCLFATKFIKVLDSAFKPYINMLCLYFLGQNYLHVTF